MWIFNPSFGVLLLCRDLFAAQGLGPPVSTPKPVMSQRALRDPRPLLQRSFSAQIKGASASVGDLCMTGQHIEKTTFKYDREREIEADTNSTREQHRSGLRLESRNTRHFIHKHPSSTWHCIHCEKTFFKSVFLSCLPKYCHIFDKFTLEA